MSTNARFLSSVFSFKAYGNTANAGYQYAENKINVVGLYKFHHDNHFLRIIILTCPVGVNITEKLINAFYGFAT